jgi:hypothetical protein
MSLSCVEHLDGMMYLPLASRQDNGGSFIMHDERMVFKPRSVPGSGPGVLALLPAQFTPLIGRGIGPEKCTH